MHKYNENINEYAHTMTEESKRRYLAREGLSETGSKPEEKTVEVPSGVLPLKRFARQ